MKKTIFLVGCLSLVLTFCFAQRERVEYLPVFDKKQLHWGYYLGLNKMTFKTSYRQAGSNIKVDQKGGFNVGLVGDLRLHDNINLRLESGIATGSKTLIFENPAIPSSDNTRELTTTYLRLPLVVKFSADRLRNFRPYLLAGLSYNHNLSSNESNPEDNSAGEFRSKTSNFMYEIGVGVDFYLYYFKFSPSIRGVFAMNNELKYDDDPNSPWTAPVAFMGTRGVFLNFSFE